MKELNKKFQETEMTESDLAGLALADQRTRRGAYTMEKDGFDRFLLYPGNGKNLVLQVERYADGHYNISIQGAGLYVMFGDDRFAELLEQF